MIVMKQSLQILNLIIQSCSVKLEQAIQVNKSAILIMEEKLLKLVAEQMEGLVLGIDMEKVNTTQQLKSGLEILVE